MTQPPTPAGYEAANSLEIPFPCREHAEQEAAYLTANMRTRKFGVRQHGAVWHVVQTAWLNP